MASVGLWSFQLLEETKNKWTRKEENKLTTLRADLQQANQVCSLTAIIICRMTICVESETMKPLVSKRTKSHMKK